LNKNVSKIIERKNCGENNDSRERKQLKMKKKKEMIFLYDGKKMSEI
jgi:hypothetical protein